MTAALIALAIVVSLAAAGCSRPDAVRDAFNADGRLIALSGGSAGAANACVACHGLKGEGDGNLAPRLAGLDQGYLARQIGFYADGQRIDPLMVAVARALTGEERQKVAAYYAGLPALSRACPAAPAAAATLYSSGDAQRGIASCASCHGADGAGNAGNPPLGGQPAAYLERQMADWREGNRYGDPEGAMARIAKALTAAESAALTAYAAGLPGDARYSAPPEGCPPARRASPRNGA